MAYRLRAAGLLLGLLLAFREAAPAAPFAYVTHPVGLPGTPGSVSVIDTLSRTVIATIAVGSSPRSPVVHPSGQLVYVLISVGDPNVGDPFRSAVAVIDATSTTVVRQVTVDSGIGDLAYDPLRDELLMSSVGCPGELVIVDAATFAERARVPVGCNPDQVVVSADSTRAYVVNTTDPDINCDFFPTDCRLSVSVVDLANRRALDPVLNVTAMFPGYIAADPRGRGFYSIGVAPLPGGSRSALSFFETTDGTVVTSRFPLFGLRMAVDQRGTRVYVTDSSNFYAVNPDTQETVGEARNIGHPVLGIALTPDGTAAFVTDDDTATVKVVDTATSTVTAVIPVFRHPMDIAIGPDVPITPKPTPTCPPATPPSCPTEEAMVCPTRTDFCVPECVCATYTPTPTCTRTASPSSSPTRPPICPGDCNRNMQTTVDELVYCVRIALGLETSWCPACDLNYDGKVTVEELVSEVNTALTGCPAA
jgi:YVTN family beta-propeller protein